MKAHNKRRNVGLVFEFLTRRVSNLLIESGASDKDGNSTLKIVKKHFKPGTELYREFKLSRSLVKTTVSSEAAARSIIDLARHHSQTLDEVSLNKQKTNLIHDINRHIITKDPDFFDQPISEYKIYATVQSLFAEWRTSTDLRKIAEYEQRLVDHLLTQKDVQDGGQVSQLPIGEARLLMKVMMRKLGEKYDAVLTNEQKEIIRAYAFSTAASDDTSIAKKLYEIKDRLVVLLESGISTDSDHVNQKLVEVKQNLMLEKLDGEIDDHTVVRFMLYSKLGSELSNDTGEKS